jgi:hypothetical protein
MNGRSKHYSSLFQFMSTFRFESNELFNVSYLLIIILLKLVLVNNSNLFFGHTLVTIEEVMSQN